VDLTNTVDFDI